MEMIPQSEGLTTIPIVHHIRSTQQFHPHTLQCLRYRRMDSVQFRLVSYSFVNSFVKNNQIDSLNAFFYRMPMKSDNGLILERYVLIPCKSRGSRVNGISLELSKWNT